jgi:hypothetical protein
MDPFIPVAGNTMVGRVPRPIFLSFCPFFSPSACFPCRLAKKILAIVKWVFYLAVQTTVHRFCTFNGSVDSEGLLWNGQQVLVTAVIVEGQHPLPGLLAIKRQ